MSQSPESGNFNDEIREIDRTTVDGYIRRIESIFNDNSSFYDVIPSIINELCMQFYNEPQDRFDPKLCGPQANRISDNIVCHHITKKDVRATALLSNIAKSGVHRWKFRFNGYTKSGDIYVGIVINNINEEEMDKVLRDFTYLAETKNGDSIFYGINARFGELRGGQDSWDGGIYGDSGATGRYCRAAEDGDIIHMILDLNDNGLGYCINDKHYGTAFNVKHTDYRAAIVISGCIKTKIELLQYDHYQK